MKELSVDFVVLGAGLSGLVAADLLIGGKKNVAVIEKEDHVGGLARTLDHGPFKFDIGGHRLCITEKNTLVYLKSLLGRDISYQKTRCKIYFESKFIDYPPCFSSIFSLKKKYFLKIISEYMMIKDKSKIHSFEDWVRFNYGDTLFSIYFKDYTEKVWGLSCDCLSCDWADKRIGKAFSSSRIIREYIPRFYYPKQGIGQLPEKIAQRVGDAIYKKSEIKEIDFFKDSGRLTFENGSERYELKFRKLLSTIPLANLVSLIRGVPSAITGSSSNIRYRDLILVCLVIKKKRLTPLHWFYTPQKSVIFSRVYEPGNWGLNLSKETDLNTACFEITCSSNNGIWNEDDSSIIKKVEADLRKIEPFENIEVLGGSVKRFAFAYPLYYLDYSISLNKVFNFISGIKNLYLLGRSGTHSYFDMEECILSAKNTVDSILNGQPPANMQRSEFSRLK